MNTRCCWPPDSSRMWRSARSLDARAARGPRATSRRSARLRHGRTPPARPGHQHALGDGDREVPVDGLDLRHVADAQARRGDGRRRRRGCTVPSSDLQQRRLARARRPDEPVNCAGRDASGRRRRAPAVPSVARSVTPVEPDQLGRIDAALTAGTPPRRARRCGRRTPRAPTASPPSASIIVT